MTVITINRLKKLIANGEPVAISMTENKVFTKEGLRVMAHFSWLRFVQTGIIA
jgi:hypothetical protein